MKESSIPNQYLFRRIVQAKLFMDNNFEKPINLEAIADGASFSKFHFLRLFKKTYGKSPHQYLTWVRLEKAKILLAQGEPVTEVCSAVGFESLSSFTGLFKRTMNIPPSQYQQLQLARKESIREEPLKFIPNCFAEQKGWTKKSNFREVTD